MRINSALSCVACLLASTLLPGCPNGGALYTVRVENESEAVLGPENGETYIVLARMPSTT